MTEQVGRLCDPCGRVTWHPKDVEEGYCGNCHDWTPGHPVRRGEWLLRAGAYRQQLAALDHDEVRRLINGNWEQP